MGIRSTQIAVQRLPGGLRRCAGRCQRYCQQRIRSQARLVRRAVLLPHAGIHPNLVCRIHAAECGGYLLMHMCHSTGHALAAVAPLIAVPPLVSLMLTGGGTTGHGSTPHDTVAQPYLCFHGRIPARVQYLARRYLADCSRIHNAAFVPCKTPVDKLYFYFTTHFFITFYNTLSNFCTLIIPFVLVTPNSRKSPIYRSVIDHGQEKPKRHGKGDGRQEAEEISFNRGGGAWKEQPMPPGTKKLKKFPGYWESDPASTRCRTHCQNAA